jgi:polysaccharide export outer membrane protein
MRSLRVVAVLASAAVLAGLAVLAGAGCDGVRSDPLPPPVTADPVETYRIVPGDRLVIDGGKHPEVSKEIAYVDQQGSISMLYIGKVMAAGKTKSELEKEIDARYRSTGQFTDSQVSITVATLFYFVDGEVAKVGRRQYIRQITLYQAIVEAGGFTNFANRDKVRVLRTHPDGTSSVYVINVARIMVGKDADTFVVLPEDRIIVPRGY